MKKILFILVAFALILGAAEADIFQAVQSGDVGLVKKLVEQNPALLKSRNEMGISVLEMAAWQGKVEIVKVLLAAGADATTVNPQGDTPLHGAALSGNCEIIRLLLEKGAAVNARGSGGDTPLHNAVAEGRLEAASLLIAKGADVNAANDEGTTPLHYAASVGEEMVKLLLAKGAGKEALDQNGERPLHYGVHAGHAKTVAALLAAGASVGPVDRFGDTPLHIAAYAGHVEAAQALLAAKPKLGVKDFRGRTPLDMAEWRRHLALAFLLRQSGDQGTGKMPALPKFAPGISETGLETPLRITILVDNAVHAAGLQSDWGFSCLIEGLEQTILFDAGSKPEIFAANVQKLGIDLNRIQKVIVSHPHGDHTGGLEVALRPRPGLPLLLPYSTPFTLTARLEAAGAVVTMVKEPLQVCRHAVLTGEMVQGPAREQSLVINTRKGLVIVTGCAHQGIVALLEQAKKLYNRSIYLVLGGFHLLMHSDEAVKEIIAKFRTLGVESCGATHCTGERAIPLFREAYKEKFVTLGAGRVVEVK